MTTSPFPGATLITFVGDANTPGQFSTYVGRLVDLTFTPLVGTAMHIGGVPGLVQQGTGGLEFLITAEGVPAPTDSAPAWAVAMAATLATINGKLDTIIGGAARNSDMQTALAGLNTIIGGAAQQGTLNAVGANVTLIKTKVGA